jgi:hypothetical protein
VTIGTLSGKKAVLAVLAVAGVGGAVGALVSTHLGVTASASNAAASASPTPEPGDHDGAPPFGHRGPHGGAVGTVTGISSSAKTLTLRTLWGTVTVTTSSTTSYAEGHRSIGFGDIKVGEVVAERGTPTGGSSTTPPASIAATRVTIQEPSVLGRVQSVSGHTITLVTGDGELAYVTTTSSTAYYQGGSTAGSSAVTAGVLVIAQGTRHDLTHLAADQVTVLPRMGEGHGMPGAPGFGFGHGFPPRMPVQPPDAATTD